MDIACGRHLQNLAKLTEPNSAFNEKWLSTKELQPDGTYKYSDVSRGKGYFYTDDAGDEEISPKYKYRKCVKEITQANQVMAIDFQCKDWMQNGAAVDYGNQILFEPINLPSGFTYAGNYLTIKHLKVDAPFYAGLFGYVYKDNLYNILLVNPSVKSRMTAYISQVYEMGVGGLVGTVFEDSDNTGDRYEITSCYTAGHIENVTQSAAGLIGYIDEQGGITKSALLVYDNYCAVIYGTGSGSSYTWDSTLQTFSLDEIRKSHCNGGR